MHPARAGAPAGTWNLRRRWCSGVPSSALVSAASRGTRGSAVSRDEAAALEIVGRESAPAPLVLQFIEVVLGIGAIAIELGDRENRMIGRDDEDRVFISGGRNMAFRLRASAREVRRDSQSPSRTRLEPAQLCACGTAAAVPLGRAARADRALCKPLAPLNAWAAFRMFLGPPARTLRLPRTPHLGASHLP